MLQSALPPPSFERDLGTIERLAATPAASATELQKALQLIYKHAATADLDAYDPAEVAKAAPEIMYRLFDVRMRLRDRLGEFEKKGVMGPGVQQALRDCFRILRYVSDMTGEIARHHGGHDTDEAGLTGFTGDAYNTLVNWPFYNARSVAFRSGDVLLVRGEHHNSAAIARIGDVDSQFSHAAIVHIDEQGAHFVVESLIEEGATINPLIHELEHGIARAVLYRHKDARLAVRAAKLIYDHVKASRTNFTKRIWYDFSMDLGENKRLFCSKLVRVAFDLASEGKVKIPRYPTKIAMHNRDFLERIGVTASETFAPSDIDIEKEFDLVCEWQDYAKTGKVRLQDFTMDKLFEWMDKYNFRFEETWAIRVVSLLGRLSAYFSDTAKDILSSVAPKVPYNMRRKTVATVAMLHKTAEPIYRELLALNEECLARNGRPLHGEEVFDHLEAIRRREGSRIGYLVVER